MCTNVQMDFKPVSEQLTLVQLNVTSISYYSNRIASSLQLDVNICII